MRVKLLLLYSSISFFSTLAHPQRTLTHSHTSTSCTHTYTHARTLTPVHPCTHSARSRTLTPVRACTNSSHLHTRTHSHTRSRARFSSLIICTYTKLLYYFYYIHFILNYLKYESNYYCCTRQTVFYQRSRTPENKAAQ